MTPEETTLIKSEIDSRWPGVDASVIHQELCRAGTANVETWMTVPYSEEKINVHKAVLLAAMTPTERAGLRAALAADDDFRMLYEAATEFTINHPTTIEMIVGLAMAVGMKAETSQGLLRMGQRLKSRSEELIGRNVTVKEVQEVQGWAQ